MNGIALSCLHLSDGQITLSGVATCMQNNHNKYAVLIVICPFQLHARDLDPGPADAEGDQARWPVHLPVHCARHLRHLLWGAFEGRAIYEDPSWTCDHCPCTGHERG